MLPSMEFSLQTKTLFTVLSMLWIWLLFPHISSAYKFYNLPMEIFVGMFWAGVSFLPSAAGFYLLATSSPLAETDLSFQEEFSL